MKQTDPKGHQAIDSYIIQRRALGILGLALPFLLFLGSQTSGWTPLKDSLSRYYFSNTRDIFVGVLISYSVFLISYRGYNRKDDVICNIAGTLALGIAVFPAVRPEDSLTMYYFEFLGNGTTRIIHYLCALTFFSFLGYISYSLFTISRGKLTVGKIKRNKFYRICGMLIFFSLLMIAITMGINFFLKSIHSPLSSIYNRILETGRPVFILESIALFAFGSSWLVKGETLWKDKDRRSPRPQYIMALCKCKKLLGRRFVLGRNL